MRVLSVQPVAPLSPCCYEYIMWDTPEQLDLEITGLAHDGRGVARLKGDGPVQGMAIFVSGGLPGQLVRVRMLRCRKSFWEGEAVAILRPAAEDVPPICPHHLQCGGCSLQTMPYSRQLHWKRVLVVDALSRIGGFDRGQLENLLDAVVPSPAVTRYRNKMEFAFAGGAGTAMTLGLRRRNGRDVLAVPGCVLMPPVAQAMVTKACQLAAESGFAAYVPLSPRCGRGDNARSRKGPARNSSGFWRFFILRRGLAGDRRRLRWWALCLTSPASDRQRMFLRAMGQALLAAFPLLAGFIHEERGAQDGLAQGEQRSLVLGPDGDDDVDATRMMLPLSGRLFSLDVASFFQVNTGAAQCLARTATGMLSPMKDGVRPAVLLDLYCGVGAPGLLVSPAYKAVLGLELDARAVQFARNNASAQTLRHCRYAACDVAAQLAELAQVTGMAPYAPLWPALQQLHRVDVLLDPPRSGLAPQALAAVQRLAPERILYISCNPSTLARDVKLLSATHTLEQLAAVDLFPHTPHVETVVLMSSRSS